MVKVLELFSGTKSVGKICDELGWEVISLDLKGDAVRAFGNVSLTPTTFLIDDQGQIVKKKIGEMKMDVWEKRIKLILNKKSG